MAETGIVQRGLRVSRYEYPTEEVSAVGFVLGL